MSEHIPARFSANFYITNDEGLVGKANYGFGGLTPPDTETVAKAAEEVLKQLPEGFRLMDEQEVMHELVRELAKKRGLRIDDEDEEEE